MAVVIAGIFQRIALSSAVQIRIQGIGHGQIALIAGHLVAVHQQACGLVAVRAVGGVVAGCLLGRVIGAGSPSAGGSDHAGHVFDHIVLIYIFAGDFVNILDAFKDDTVVVTPVEEIGLAVFTLFVVPGEVGLEVLYHSPGIIAGIVDCNSVNVGFCFCHGCGQSCIRFGCVYMRRHHACKHYKSQKQGNHSLCNLHMFVTSIFLFSDRFCLRFWYLADFISLL